MAGSLEQAVRSLERALKASTVQAQRGGGRGGPAAGVPGLPPGFAGPDGPAGRPAPTRRRQPAPAAGPRPSVIDTARSQLTSIAAGRALGGGLAGLAGAGALAAGVAGVAAAGAVAAPAFAGGVVNAARGGTFQAGAASGAIRGINSVLPSFIAETLGTAPTERIEAGATGRANAITNRIAELGGAEAVSPRLRQFIAERSLARARNVELDQQSNAAAVKEVQFGGKSISEIASDIGHNVGG